MITVAYSSDHRSCAAYTLLISTSHGSDSLITGSGGVGVCGSYPNILGALIDGESGWRVPYEPCQTPLFLGPELKSSNTLSCKAGNGDFT
jgi:hypothetical protein